MRPYTPQRATHLPTALAKVPAGRLSACKAELWLAFGLGGPCGRFWRLTKGYARPTQQQYRAARLVLARHGVII